MALERDVLQKVHLNGLALRLAEKLNTRIGRLKETDFHSQVPFMLEDIEPLLPVVNYDTPTLYSVEYLLELARKRDSAGKRSVWYMKGGEERKEATDLFRSAVSVAEQVHGGNTLKYALVLKELAEHLESRHQEKGRPENSLWNHSAAIIEDDQSMEARYFYELSLENMKRCRAENSLETA